jgi:hypothetical protein
MSASPRGEGHRVFRRFASQGAPSPDLTRDRNCFDRYCPITSRKQAPHTINIVKEGHCDYWSRFFSGNGNNCSRARTGHNVTAQGELHILSRLALLKSCLGAQLRFALFANRSIRLRIALFHRASGITVIVGELGKLGKSIARGPMIFATPRSYRDQDFLGRPLTAIRNTRRQRSGNDPGGCKPH